MILCFCAFCGFNTLCFLWLKECLPFELIEKNFPLKTSSSQSVLTRRSCV
jgi:hypothetical protein